MLGQKMLTDNMQHSNGADLIVNLVEVLHSGLNTTACL